MREFVFALFVLFGASAPVMAAAPDSNAKLVVTVWVSPQDLQGFRISNIFKKLEKRFKSPAVEFSVNVTREPGFDLFESTAIEYIDRIGWRGPRYFDADGVEANTQRVHALPSIVITGTNLKPVTVAAGRIVMSDIEKALLKIMKEQNISLPTGREISNESDFSGCFQGETTFMGEKRSKLLGDLKPQHDDHWIEKENLLRSEKNKKSRLSFDFSGTTLGLIAQSVTLEHPARLSAIVDNSKPLIFNVEKLRVYEVADRLSPGSHRLTLDVQSGSIDLFGLQSLNSCPE